MSVYVMGGCFIYIIYIYIYKIAIDVIYIMYLYIYKFYSMHMANKMVGHILHKYRTLHILLEDEIYFQVVSQ